jgi:hypothetical protein
VFCSCAVFFRYFVLFCCLFVLSKQTNTQGNNKNNEENNVKKNCVNQKKKQRSRILKYMKINIWWMLHTWRWSCRPKYVVKDSGNQHTIKLHADGNITCNTLSWTLIDCLCQSVHWFG